MLAMKTFQDLSLVQYTKNREQDCATLEIEVSNPGLLVFLTWLYKVGKNQTLVKI